MFFRTFFRKNVYLCIAKKVRGVAQLVSAPRSGRGGRKFESSHPDPSLFSSRCHYCGITVVRQNENKRAAKPSNVRNRRCSDRREQTVGGISTTPSGLVRGRIGWTTANNSTSHEAAWCVVWHRRPQVRLRLTLRLRIVGRLRRPFLFWQTLVLA